MSFLGVLKGQVPASWVAVGGVWLVCGALYLSLPPSPDQFEHSYLGWRLLRGAVPYRDVIDMNWPGVLWMHTLSAALFGNQLWSWRALDLIMLAASAFFLRHLVNRAAGVVAANLSLLLYPLFYVSIGQWFPGQHDTTAGQLLLPALWCHVRGYESRNWRWQVGTGMFLALAMLSKPTVGILGLLLPGHALLARVPLRPTSWHTAVTAAACIAGLAVALLALLAQGTALAEVIEAVYTYNVWTQYLQRATPESLARSWYTLHVVVLHVLSFLAALGAGWLLRGARGCIGAAALHVLWLTGVLSFLLQQRGFMYHLGPAFIAIVGLAAAALGRCLELGRRYGAAPWGTLVGALPLLVALAAGAKKLHDTYEGLPEAIREGNYDLFLAKFKEGDGLNVAQALALARQIEREIPPEETVLVLGTASSMNFLSRRAQPTRLYYAPMLVNARPPLPMANRWIRAFEQDLERTTPRWCLISTGIGKQWLQGDSPAAGALRDLLASRYRRTRVITASDGRALYEIHERLR